MYGKIWLQFENFIIYKDFENFSTVRDGKSCQEEPILWAPVASASPMNPSNFRGSCNRYYRNIGPKICRLPTFNMFYPILPTFFQSESWSRDQTFANARGNTSEFQVMGWSKVFVGGSKIFDSGIFLGRKIWQVFFGWLNLSMDFWGVLRTMWRFVVLPRSFLIYD